MAKGWHQKQKERGDRLILSWFEPRKCWKKYKDGKTKYFHHPDSAAGYGEAVAEYHSWLREQRDFRTLAAEYGHHIALLDKCCEWYERFGTPVSEDKVDEEGIRDEVFDLRGRLTETLETSEELPPIPDLLPNGDLLARKQFLSRFDGKGVVGTEYESNPLDPRFGALGWEPPDVWQERIRQLDVLSSHQRKLPQTVGHQVQRFLIFKELQVTSGVITARTWGTLNERLKFFVDWIKPGTHVATIDGTTLTGFYEWVLMQPSWQHQRAKGIFNTARQWVRWAWRQDNVELETLPKNIDSREEFVFLAHIDKTGVSKKTRTELLWTPDEFHHTLALVPEDFQLFLLLMLNCGFTNTDVASLLKSEVQLDEGRIVRQRTKTRRHAHPPVVNYKLWPKTLELLRKHWSKHPTVALTNRKGNPLAVSKLVKEGTKTREVAWTTIGRRYIQMKTAKPKKKVKPQLADKQLKFLRKTGSTKIRSKREFLSLDSLYLGHSWANVADKHYNAFDGQPYEPLDEAIDWLGKEFRIL
jgi:integrase